MSPRDRFVENGAARIAQLARQATARRFATDDQHGARVLRPRHVRSRVRACARRARPAAANCCRPDDPGIAEALHYVGVAAGFDSAEHEAGAGDARGSAAPARGGVRRRTHCRSARRCIASASCSIASATTRRWERRCSVRCRFTSARLAPTIRPRRRCAGCSVSTHYLVSEHAAAREALQRSLVVLERAYGKDSIRVVDALHTLGRLEWQLGAFPEAIEFYSRALAIKEAHFGREHPDLGTTLYGLAVSNKDLGALSESRVYYDRVIELQQKVLGPEDFYLALSLQRLWLPAAGARRARRREGVIDARAGNRREEMGAAPSRPARATGRTGEGADRTGRLCGSARTSSGRSPSSNRSSRRSMSMSCAR